MAVELIFIHGAFCGGWAFEQFREPFETRGYKTHAPNLPHHESGADLEALARCGVEVFADAVATYTRRFAEPPVLVGHSLGGLIVQMAAARAPVSALVLLAPSAPWGVMPSTLDEQANNMGLLALGDYWNRAVPPDYRVARKTTLDGLSKPEARAAFGQFVPESGRAVFEAVQWWRDPNMASTAPVAKITCPILAFGGGADKVNPAATVQRIVSRFPRQQASYVELPGISHWPMGEPGWEGVTRQIIGWLADQDLSPSVNIASDDPEEQRRQLEAARARTGWDLSRLFGKRRS